MLTDDVKGAVDRMCTPLDPSVLHGATAEADASCMAAIRAHLEAQEAEIARLRADLSDADERADLRNRERTESVVRAEKAEAMLRMLLPYLDAVVAGFDRARTDSRGCRGYRHRAVVAWPC
jgi:hypothetical protein